MESRMMLTTRANRCIGTGLFEFSSIATKDTSNGGGMVV